MKDQFEYLFLTSIGGSLSLSLSLHRFYSLVTSTSEGTTSEGDKPSDLEEAS